MLENVRMATKLSLMNFESSVLGYKHYVSVFEPYLGVGCFDR